MSAALAIDPPDPPPYVSPLGFASSRGSGGLRLVVSNHGPVASTWTVTVGAVAGGALLPRCVQTAHTPDERTARTGEWLELMEGVDGVFVDVIEWRGGQLARRSTRVWKGGSWREGGRWEGPAWRDVP